MADYLMRDAAPLTDEEWAHLDKVVVETARRFLAWLGEQESSS